MVVPGWNPKGYLNNATHHVRWPSMTVRKHWVALCWLWAGVSYAEALDSTTGLIKDEGWQLVAAHCGGCHSLQLVTAIEAMKKFG